MKKKKMKTGLKVFLMLTAVIIVAFASFAIFITSGLKDMEKAEIGPVDISSVPDGVYTGRFEGNRWANTLEVTVQGGKITDIKVLKAQMISKEGLAEQVFAQVEEKQSLQIDAVSGATVSTKGYLLAIEDALKNKK